MEIKRTTIEDKTLQPIKTLRYSGNMKSRKHRKRSI